MCSRCTFVRRRHFVYIGSFETKCQREAKCSFSGYGRRRKFLWSHGRRYSKARKDVYSEEMECSGHVELGRRMRHLCHLPGASHGWVFDNITLILFGVFINICCSKVVFFRCFQAQFHFLSIASPTLFETLCRKVKSDSASHLFLVQASVFWVSQCIFPTVIVLPMSAVWKFEKYFQWSYQLMNNCSDIFNSTVSNWHFFLYTVCLVLVLYCF